MELIEVQEDLFGRVEKIRYMSLPQARRIELVQEFMKMEDPTGPSYRMWLSDRGIDWRD